MNLKPFRRLAITVAATSAAMTGVAGFAIITQPASTSAPDMTREVTYVDPVADEVTTTTTAPAPVVHDSPERAETAAVRGEVAAGRAEVAATKAETVATTTTTTGSVTPTTSTPILVDVTPIPTTSTTTTLPPRWVEVVRIPARAASFPPVDQFAVNLANGRLRVTDPKAGMVITPGQEWGKVAIWVGPSETPPADACILPQDTCEFPAGAQTLRVAREYVRGPQPGWYGVYGTQADLVLEELR